ncbi:MAG: hypothetical protein HFI81_08335 [Eubacterium sp.]|jgi:hypothetical protein|nr:hypothetical protein [Eubacterium sp.]
MVGNVGQIVESMNAANNARSGQNTANAASPDFKDYLETALLSSRNGLFSSGLGGGYSYLNPLSGSVWQTAMLEALRDELKKGRKSEEKEGETLKEDVSSSQTEQTKKEDWVSIRVIRRYQSPHKEESGGNVRVLV